MLSSEENGSELNIPGRTLGVKYQLLLLHQGEGGREKGNPAPSAMSHSDTILFSSFAPKLF